MKKFILVYFGGDQPAPEDGKKVMDQWMAWFNDLGEAVVDGGFPVMPGIKRIGSDMSITDGKSGITGYSVVKADSKEKAIEIAKKCPHLLAGGDVEVIEEAPLNM